MARGPGTQVRVVVGAGRAGGPMEAGIEVATGLGEVKRMTDDFDALVRELAEVRRRDRRLLVLTDYDGTLTPIVPHPADAYLTPAMRECLRELSRVPRVSVGVVSGRGLGDLLARVGVAGLTYAGCHGLDLVGPRVRFQHGGALARRALVGDVTRRLGRRCVAIPGVRLEPKALSVAVHHRHVPPDTMPRLRATLDEVLAPHGDDLATLPGKQVLEILPRVGWTKGDCALWLEARARAAAPRGVTTLYLGDDHTDEFAFQALAGRAITVKVGPSRGDAAHCVPDVTAVYRLLTALSAS
jgi:trehalose 6-phosphate phosphatase